MHASSRFNKASSFSTTSSSAATHQPYHQQQQPHQLTSIASHIHSTARQSSYSASSAHVLSSRAFSLIRFPDPHPNLAPGDVPPALQGPEAFSQPLHMRRELIPRVALSQAEIKAGGDIMYGKRGKETQTEYNARRLTMARHRDEYRWVLENSAGSMKYEGKEVTEHAGTHMAIFPSETPGGPYTIARVDLWIDLKRHVDLTEVKARVSDQTRVKQLTIARKRNMQSAVANVEGKQSGGGQEQDDDNDGYHDPDLDVDHTYDLAIDRAGRFLLFLPSFFAD